MPDLRGGDGSPMHGTLECTAVPRTFMTLRVLPGADREQMLGGQKWEPCLESGGAGGSLEHSGGVCVWWQPVLPQLCPEGEPTVVQLTECSPSMHAALNSTPSTP